MTQSDMCELINEIYNKDNDIEDGYIDGHSSTPINTCTGFTTTNFNHDIHGTHSDMIYTYKPWAGNYILTFILVTSYWILL